MRRMLTEQEVKEIAGEGQTYTAGEGISIEDNVIGVNFNLVATCNYVDSKIAEAIGQAIGGSY